jgi:hypothetical protein
VGSNPTSGTNPIALLREPCEPAPARPNRASAHAGSGKKGARR